ncbi:FliM/FliN family flagellar motor switch protein [Hansschlegelia plantiphila]|uniref:Flagellar motor switch protein FliN-like C-terminal domain-containing protein n=1 Tax=Hansschlegelia plantiphila TaxID=374655 RepID=A0A9W6J517_9HYPH|nr:FliM/FliN family flagellar motor switch protein [Hansschlegelia plantiphila]GLK69398.1 hypothetical protein GCM10008179_30360 [Hansschlegelia plantiphila]
MRPRRRGAYGDRVPPIDKVNLDISVVLGAATIPIHQLLRMGRGAVIELSAMEGAAVTLLANDHPIAYCAAFVNDERIGVEITTMPLRPEKGRSERVAEDVAA